MKSMMIGMLAETPIHPGSGRSAGFVDLPVARESVTDYPVIVGSSLKGALKDRAREKWSDVPKEGDEIKKELSKDVAEIFGVQDDAGKLAVSDARLILLPVRSLISQFKWVTCPYLVERLGRDLMRSDLDTKFKKPILDKKPDKGSAFSVDDAKWLFLEEREFKITGKPDSNIVESVKSLIAHKDTAERLVKQLVILNDDDFKWFASYGLSINARNVLDAETKKSKNLWYEETLSPDSLFYAVLFERGAGALDLVQEMLQDHPFLQVGGNETIGQGWFALKMLVGSYGNGK
jgi:CRISPR-associated protein Cmr4